MSCRAAVISCVRVASCRPGIFVSIWGLGQIWPEVQPQCRSPPTSVSVNHSPNTETEVNMTIINLRDIYPFYTSDCFMEVPDEIAAAMAEFDRKEVPLFLPL